MVPLVFPWFYATMVPLIAVRSWSVSLTTRRVSKGPTDIPRSRGHALGIKFSAY